MANYSKRREKREAANIVGARKTATGRAAAIF